MGDSKTASGDWQPILLAGLRAGGRSIESVLNLGISGRTVATTAAALDEMLARIGPTATVSDVLVNLGVNEMDEPASGPPPGIVEAIWKQQYLEILDRVHAKWPLARVRLMRPWRRDFDFQAGLVSSWIDAIVAARPEFVLPGPDEAIWLEGGDDGLTNTGLDGLHYSGAGVAACAAEWLALLAD